MVRILIILTCAGCCLMDSSAFAQGRLRDLGRQLRDRVRNAIEDATDPAPEAEPDAPSNNVPYSTQPRRTSPHPTPAGREPGYLGATVDDRNDRGKGVRVVQVRAGSPADRAGLKAGDLITGVASLRVREMADLAAVLEQAPAGARLTFQILRNDKQRRVDVVLSRRPAGETGPDASDLAEPGDSRNATPQGPSLGQPADAGQLLPGRAVPDEPADRGKIRLDEDNRARIELLERRLDRFEARFDRLEARIDELEKSLLEYLKKK